MIDVLSDGETVPIIVGDDAEMSELQGVNRDPEGRFHLVLNGQQVALSEPASENFRTAKHLLLVRVTPGDEIATARKVRIDRLDDGQDLSADQRHALAKALTLSGGSPREFSNNALDDFRRTYPDLVAAA